MLLEAGPGNIQLPLACTHLRSLDGSNYVSQQRGYDPSCTSL
jgi:hypothetical protein